MMEIDADLARVLLRAAAEYGTPCYVYLVDQMRARARQLNQAFGHDFIVSYAIKSNPNRRLLSCLRTSITELDASSIGEVERAMDAGFDAGAVGLSGPAKRQFELQGAVDVGVGHVIAESIGQLEKLNAIAEARGRRPKVLIRINPRLVPKRFGLRMGGGPSQFGIDQERVPGVIDRFPGWRGLQFAGFHIFSAGNSLDVAAIGENVRLMIDAFLELADYGNRQISRLVFGAGFGIPYFDGDVALDLQQVAAFVKPEVDRLRQHHCLERSKLVLEMGRWLVGPSGYLLTSVVDVKESRGTKIVACDAGFNNHLSAAGMMGTVMRRNWRLTNLSKLGEVGAGPCRVVGPLCASFDLLAVDLNLPETTVDDVIAIPSSGAYGLTASPNRFISHPEPREVLVHEDSGRVRFEDASDVTSGRHAGPRSVLAPAATKP